MSSNLISQLTDRTTESLTVAGSMCIYVFLLMMWGSWSALNRDLCEYSRRFPYLGRGRQTTVGLSTTAIFSFFAGYFSDTLETKPALFYSVCRQKVTPFWYLSFLSLLDALYLQFLFTYISFSLNAWYQSQVSSVHADGLSSRMVHYHTLRKPR